MENKKEYISPQTSVDFVSYIETIMLEASLHDDEADFVGAKDNNNLIEETEALPAGKNIWGDEEE